MEKHDLDALRYTLFLPKGLRADYGEPAAGFTKDLPDFKIDGQPFSDIDMSGVVQKLNQQSANQIEEDLLRAAEMVVKEFNYNTPLKVYRNDECQHEYQHYEGLFEVYDYCTKCDFKKK